MRNHSYPKLFSSDFTILEYSPGKVNNEAYVKSSKSDNEIHESVK